MEINETSYDSGKHRLRTNPMLWTEKYKSFKFFDLLTDEQTNRNVLTWFKSWDELVFDRNINLKMPQSMLYHNKEKQAFGGAPLTNGSKPKFNNFLQN